MRGTGTIVGYSHVATKNVPAASIAAPPTGSSLVKSQVISWVVSGACLERAWDVARAG